MLLQHQLPVRHKLVMSLLFFITSSLLIIITTLPDTLFNTSQTPIGFNPGFLLRSINLHVTKLSKGAVWDEAIILCQCWILFHSSTYFLWHIAIALTIAEVVAFIYTHNGYFKNMFYFVFVLYCLNTWKIWYNFTFKRRYGIRFSHIFEIFSVSNEKPGILIKIPSILIKNLGFHSKY